MRPASPRKSSTSSGRAPFDRPRYLGLEVAGEPLPRLTLHDWEERLRSALDRARAPDVRFRVVRVEGSRAIAAVAHSELARAREAWNSDLEGAARGRIRTHRTWGTLVDAKAWMVREPPGRGPRDRIS